MTIRVLVDFLSVIAILGYTRNDKKRDIYLSFFSEDVELL